MFSNKTSLSQAMGSNGGFLARAPGGKGKRHRYDLSGAVASPGLKEPADPAGGTDPTDEEDGEPDASDGEFKSLTVTPSDNGGFLIECQYNDDGSGNMKEPSTHTFEDAQGALDFLTKKLTGETQEDAQGDDSGSGASDSADMSLGY